MSQLILMKLQPQFNLKSYTCKRRW